MNDESKPEEQASSPADDLQSAPPEQPPEQGFSLEKVIADAKAVVTDPGGFYRAMPHSGGYANPAIHVAVMGLVMGVLMAVLSVLGASGVGSMQAGFFAIIMMPIFAVIGSFIAALIMFVIWKLMGSDCDYEASYRCVAYAASIYPVMGILSIVPYLGAIVGVLWGSYLIYSATVEVHKIKQETARIVIGIIAVLMLWSQLSAEYARRHFESRFEEAAEKIGVSVEDSLKDLENLDEMTPEEAGRKLGEFFKGMNEGMEQFEQGFEEGAQEGSGSQ